MLACACAATACYSPELRDCTLQCASASDCASGQLCSSDHFCVSSDRSCATPLQDAGVRDDAIGQIAYGDAAVETAIDAAVDVPIDAPTTGAITVSIEGKGWVQVVGHGTCDSDAPQNGTCTFIVPLELPVSATANADNDWYFDRWTTSACPDESNPTCTFVPQVVMQVGVKFRKAN